MPLSKAKFSRGMTPYEYMDQIKVNKQPFLDIYRAVEVPAVAVHAVEMRVARGTVRVEEPDIGLVIRRIEYDHALARAAI